MKRAEALWKLQRLSGFIAMCCLGLAFAALFDGLRTGIFGSGGTIRLIPGEKFAVSGPMPPKTERIQDFVLDGSSDDAVRLAPEGIFTGYWFGGGMWRGYIEVAGQSRSGEYIIKVRDRFGEKQNPALVFQILVFPDDAARRKTSPSLIIRWTPLDPYWTALVLAVFGMVAGGLNFLLGKKWHAVLRAHGCGEIFRLKTVGGHQEASVDISAAHIPIGAVYTFAHPARGELGRGHVIACGKDEITLALAPEVPVRPGDIAYPKI